MSAPVLDASAVLAWLRQDPAAQRVEGALPGAGVSSVTLAVVLDGFAARGGDVRVARVDLEAYGLVVHPFTAEHAQLCAQWPASAPDVPLPDRAAFALARTLDAPLWTARAVPDGAAVPPDVTVVVLA